MHRLPTEVASTTQLEAMCLFTLKFAHCWRPIVTVKCSASIESLLCLNVMLDSLLCSFFWLPLWYLQTLLTSKYFLTHWWHNLEGINLPKIRTEVQMFNLRIIRTPFYSTTTGSCWCPMLIPALVHLNKASMLFPFLVEFVFLGWPIHQSPYLRQ